MSFRSRLQVAEALGPVNCWYCSQCHGYRVENPELLLMYFIKSGGAHDFAKRFDEAMGPLNRWYCSEFYGQDVRDPEALWNYYIDFGRAQRRRDDRNNASQSSAKSSPELSTCSC